VPIKCSREVRVLRLRYGLDDGEPKTLEQVGADSCWPTGRQIGRQGWQLDGRMDGPTDCWLTPPIQDSGVRMLSLPGCSSAPCVRTRNIEDTLGPFQMQSSISGIRLVIFVMQSRTLGPCWAAINGILTPLACASSLSVTSPMDNKCATLHVK
jgi:hypothetical protein